MTDTRAQRIRQASFERREQQKEATRRRILEAAAQLFDAVGYAGFSLRQVAERAGYTATAVYAHFQDKDDLIFSVAHTGFETFYTWLSQALHTAHTPLDRLQALAVAYVRFGLTYPMHYRLMFMQGSDFLTACAEGKQPRVASLNLLIHAVEQAITAGDLDGNRVSAQQLTAALWSAVHGPVSLHLSQPALLPLPLVLPTAQTLVQATLDRFSPPG